MGFGVIDQLAQRLKRRAHRHDQHVGRGCRQDDGVEVLDRIEILVGRDGDVHAQGLRAEMQRIAIGRGLGGGGGADVAAGARTVPDHHVLAPGLAELLRQDAPERVDGAAGRKRNQDADRPVGIGLRHGVGRPAKDRGDDRGDNDDNGQEFLGQEFLGQEFLGQEFSPHELLPGTAVHEGRHSCRASDVADDIGVDRIACIADRSRAKKSKAADVVCSAQARRGSTGKETVREAEENRSDG